MIPWYLTRIIADYDNRTRYLLFLSCGLNRSTKQQYLKSTSGSIHPYPNWLCSSPQCDIIQIHNNEWMNALPVPDTVLTESFTHPFIDLINTFVSFSAPNSTPDVRCVRRSCMPLKWIASIIVLLSGTISLTCINYNYVLRIEHLGRSPAQTNPGNRRSICW